MDASVRTLLDAVAVFIVCERSMNGRNVDERVDAIIAAMSRDTGLGKTVLRFALEDRILQVCLQQDEADDRNLLMAAGEVC